MKKNPQVIEVTNKNKSVKKKGSSLIKNKSHSNKNKKNIQNLHINNLNININFSNQNQPKLSTHRNPPKNSDEIKDNSPQRLSHS